MVDKVNTTLYKCSICDAVYGTEREALNCEKRPRSKDKGVKIGDIILITGGDGTGQKAKVTSIFVYDKSWGHYAWERYWHTVGLSADIIGGYGSRQLTFDDYEVVNHNEHRHITL